MTNHEGHKEHEEKSEMLKSTSFVFFVPLVVNSNSFGTEWQQTFYNLPTSASS
jgi:hypothetical protein